MRSWELKTPTARNIYSCGLSFQIEPVSVTEIRRKKSEIDQEKRSWKIRKMAGDPLVMSSIVSPTSELISKCINESGLFGDLSVPDYNQGYDTY